MDTTTLVLAPETRAGPRVSGAGSVSSRRLRPLLGSPVTVNTLSRTLQGTLLSCVRSSAWLVVDDDDVVVHLDEIVSVYAS